MGEGLTINRIKKQTDSYLGEGAATPGEKALSEKRQAEQFKGRLHFSLIHSMSNHIGQRRLNYSFMPARDVSIFHMLTQVQAHSHILRKERGIIYTHFRD